MTKIAVIGAGISGLSFARSLSSYADVVVFEKSRGFGGRLATRRADGYVFDHGAPYFRATTPRFMAEVNQMQAEGSVDNWRARFAEIRHGQIASQRIWGDQPAHFTGRPSMNEIGKFLARGLTIHTEHRLTSAKRVNERWQLEFDGLGAFAQSFDMLILAIPAPQAAAIIADEWTARLPAIQTAMTGCFALMLGFDTPVDLGFDAALIDDPVLSWLSVETSKPGRQSKSAITVLSRNDWAQAHMEEDLAELQSQMLRALQAIIPARVLEPAYQNIHRWRYANAAAKRPAEVIFDQANQIGLCGDWCEGGRVETAFNAGIRLADHILSLWDR